MPTFYVSIRTHIYFVPDSMIRTKGSAVSKTVFALLELEILEGKHHQQKENSSEDLRKYINVFHEVEPGAGSGSGCKQEGRHATQIHESIFLPSQC